MATLEVLKFPDSRLRRKSLEVKEITSDLIKLSDDLLETMRVFSGIGISAPQVNRLVRLIIADTRRGSEDDDDDDIGDNGSDREIELERGSSDEGTSNKMTDLEKNIEQPLIIFNPAIVYQEGKITYDEGCLSIPSYFETIERFKLIEVEGLNIKGKKISVRTDGLLSICLQHEIDHLDGKLFIDRLSPIKASRIRNKIKKFGYPDKDSDKDRNLEEGGE